MKIYNIEIKIPWEKSNTVLSFQVFVKTEKDALEIVEAMYYSLWVLTKMWIIWLLEIGDKLEDALNTMAHALMKFKEWNIWKSKKWLFEEWVKQSWSMEELKEEDLSLEDKMKYKKFTNKHITVNDILWTT